MISAKKSLIFLLVIFLAGCSYQASEKSRVSSPDHKVDVVVSEIETDATVATPTRIYIVPNGKGIEGSKPILNADKFKIKSINWVGSNQLVIAFYSGRVFHFENTWASKKNNLKGDIRIFLVDTNAPQ